MQAAPPATEVPSQTGRHGEEEQKADPQAEWRSPLPRGRSLEGFSAAEEGAWREGGFSFVQFADCQLGFEMDNRSFEREEEMLLLAVAKINAMRPLPRMAAMCGDLVHAWPTDPVRRAAQVAAYKRATSNLREEVLLVCACGNHDIGNTPSPATLRLWNEDFGQDYFSFWLQGVLFIVLNTSLYKDASAAQQEAATQSAWLREQLQTVTAAKHRANEGKEEGDSVAPRCIIALGHIPPFIDSPTEPDGYFNWEKGTRAAFLEQLKQAGVAAMLCGHYHRNAGGQDEGLEVVVTAAVGVQLADGEPSKIGKGGRLDLPVEFAKPKIGPSVSGLRLCKVTEKGFSHKWFALQELEGSPATP